MSLLRANSPLALGVGLPIAMAAGGGVLYTVTDFPVLASLPISQNAKALSFYAFVRSFANVSFRRSLASAYRAVSVGMGGHNWGDNHSERVEETITRKYPECVY